MKRRGGGSSAQISAKRAKSALVMLLTGCTRERLASFTPESLASSYNVPLADCQQLLARARQGTLL